jgi:hypothetical protein
MILTCKQILLRGSENICALTFSFQLKKYNSPCWRWTAKHLKIVQTTGNFFASAIVFFLLFLCVENGGFTLHSLLAFRLSKGCQFS